MEGFRPELFVLITLFSFSTYNVIVRAGSTEYTALTASFLISGGNFILLGGFGLWRTSLAGFPLPAAAYFLGSGVFGYIFSRTLSYRGFETVGVSRTAALHGSTPLLSVLLAIFLLGERPGFAALAGTVAVVTGVFLLTGLGGRRRGFDWGCLYGLGAAVASSFSMYYRKKGLILVDAPALGTAISCFLALPVLGAGIRFVPSLGGFRCTRRGAGYLAAAVLVNSLGQFFLMRSLYVAGMAFTVSLYAMRPLVVLGLTSLFLRRIERVTGRLAVAVVLTVGGAILITASRRGLLG